MSIYTCVCVGAPFYPLGLGWRYSFSLYNGSMMANGELSFQRQGSELMFYNDSLMDEGDLAHLGEATIAGMMSLEVLFVPGHDCG